MGAKAGDRIVVESTKVGQPQRRGVIEEIVRDEPSCYRVRWDDGRLSVIVPAAGAARIEPRGGRERR